MADSLAVDASQVHLVSIQNDRRLLPTVEMTFKVSSNDEAEADELRRRVSINHLQAAYKHEGLDVEISSMSTSTVPPDASTSSASSTIVAQDEPSATISIIMGGVVGGLAFLAAGLFVWVHVCRRRSGSKGKGEQNNVASGNKLSPNNLSESDTSDDLFGAKIQGVCVSSASLLTSESMEHSNLVIRKDSKFASGHVLGNRVCLAHVHSSVGTGHETPSALLGEAFEIILSPLAQQTGQAWQEAPQETTETTPPLLEEALQEIISSPLTQQARQAWQSEPEPEAPQETTRCSPVQTRMTSSLD